MSRSASLALAGLSALAAAAPTGFLPLDRFDLSARQDGFVSCLDTAGIETVVQGDAEWADDSASYNLRLPYKPSAIVYPEDAAQVSAAVKCAAPAGVKVNARSGGHSYAAFGLGGEDGHLIVSLDKLKGVTVDGSSATIGAGNRLGEVAVGLFEQGERAMAHGTCPFVGMGGHAGHGGFGLPSRGWGTVLDQVTAMEVVTADGEIVKASNEENEDLFFAMRGAASSFGIVTSFTTVTQAAPAHNVWFTYTWSSLDAKKASSYLQTWQEFAAGLPAEYGFQIHINPQQGTTPNFVVDGYCYGDESLCTPAITNATIGKLLDQYDVAPDAVQVQDQTWMEQLLFLGGVQNKQGLLDNPDYHYAFYATSLFVSEDEPMTVAASDKFMEYLWTTATEANAAVGWYLIFDLYGGAQSVITQVPDDATAFDGRDALYSIQLWGQSPSGELPVPEQTVPLMQGMVKSITDNQPETHFKGYFNYVDSELSREEAIATYFPTHADQLAQIKTKYDPNSVFEYPQSFLPA